MAGRPGGYDAPVGGDSSRYLAELSPESADPDNRLILVEQSLQGRSVLSPPFSIDVRGRHLKYYDVVISRITFIFPQALRRGPRKSSEPSKPIGQFFLYFNIGGSLKSPSPIV
jgi:hypothetical protein